MEQSHTVEHAGAGASGRGHQRRGGDSSAAAPTAPGSIADRMLAALPTPAAALGAGGDVLEWNPAAERAVAIARSDAIGRELADLLIAAGGRRAAAELRARLAPGTPGEPEPLRVELAPRAKGAETRSFELQLVAAPGNRPEAAYAFLREVGERERAFAAEIRRRDSLTSLGQSVLAGEPPASLAARAAELARSELGAETVQIWAQAEASAPAALLAAAGWEANGALGTLAVEIGHLDLGRADGDAEQALRQVELAEQAWRPPATEVSQRGIQSGIAVRFAVGPGVYGVLAAHGAQEAPIAAGDAGFLAPLCQILGAALGRERVGDELARAERRYRELIERLPVVTYLAEYGPHGRWIYVSPQIESLLGYTPEEWLADRDLWWSRVHPEDRERVEAEEERCAQTLESLAGEYRMIARDGSVVWVRDEGALGRPVDGGAVQVEGVLTDVTERKRAEEALRHRAEHDDLTGLPNRRRFEEELGLRRSECDAVGAVALLDLDSLKFVNDSLGHAAGDALLRGVAHCLRDELAEGEFLARFGGDEFAVLLCAASEAAVCERIGTLVRQVRTRDSRLPATISAGVVLFDGSKAATDEDLLIAADIALHEAKEHGGDRLAVFKGEGRERLAWVEHVRMAIDSDRLLVHAQPIVHLATGIFHGNELLVRMRDDDGAVLPPSAFLPTAERFGLIREIDGWMIERAVEIVARGSAATVNLSARSIADPDLKTQIGQALEASGADPTKLVFEITETAAATAIEELRSFGAAIERLGCALAIDDFGTGFGSLTYLKHLPVRYLKIDMEFVRGLASSASDRAIVHSIVTIASSLGMRTVAEGVEDEATMERLRVLGVDFAQGYHVGRPVLLELARE